VGGGIQCASSVTDSVKRFLIVELATAEFLMVAIQSLAPDRKGILILIFWLLPIPILPPKVLP
jgi:hypothetical protein